jgi:hypothetical protein
MGFILDINRHVIWSHEKYTTEVYQWIFELVVFNILCFSILLSY